MCSGCSLRVSGSGGACCRALRLLLCLGVALRESIERGGVWVLVESEQLGASPLDVLTVDMRALVFGVENEPQLDAWVRHGKVDAVLVGESAGFGEVGVFIDVEHTPVAVVAGAASAAFVLEAPAAFCDGVSHDRERCPMAVVDDHGDSLAVLAVEMREVDRFGRLALCEDEYPAFWRRCRDATCRSRTSAQASAPDSWGVRFSRTAANSASLTIGTAPYIPWR